MVKDIPLAHSHRGEIQAQSYFEHVTNVRNQAIHNAQNTAAYYNGNRDTFTGKTTAIMAHLLRVASERNPELRHIIVVLPFINIITQSVDIYRKALVLEGERPENVVAEHIIGLTLMTWTCANLPPSGKLQLS